MIRVLRVTPKQQRTGHLLWGQANVLVAIANEHIGTKMGGDVSGVICASGHQPKDGVEINHHPPPLHQWLFTISINKARTYAPKHAHTHTSYTHTHLLFSLQYHLSSETSLEVPRTLLW